MLIFLGIVAILFIFSCVSSLKKNGLVTFFNLSIIYYIFFVSFLYYHIFFDLNPLLDLTNDRKQLYLNLSYWYSICLLIAGIVYNLFLSKIQSSYSTNKVISINLSKIKVLLLAVLILKLYIFFFIPTPLDTLIKSGFVAAHNLQKKFHIDGGLTRLFLSFFHFFGTFLALILALEERNKYLQIIYLLFSIFFSGWYFSKSMLLVPLITFFVCKLNKKKLIYQSFLLLLFICVSIFLVFALRLNAFNFEYVIDKLLSRFFFETGFSLIHFDLIVNENLPLFYESRYFFGFNTLFNITPIIDYSRDANEIYTGKYGATTSGYAPVHLYAFFGIYSFFVIPIIIFIISYLDFKIIKKLKFKRYLYSIYLLASVYLINSLTVDLFRIISPAFIFSKNVYYFFIIFFIISLLIQYKFVLKNKKGS